MNKFEQTKNLLEITYNDARVIVYYTFKTPSNTSANYYHVIERKEYYLVGLYSGDVMKYYRNENKIEYVNTVTYEVKIVTDRTYKIIQE